MQTGQEIPFVKGDRVRVFALDRQDFQDAGIAPEYIRVHAHFLIAAGRDCGLTDRPSQMVQRLPERGTRMRVIKLWPEHGHERVTPVKGSAGIDSQERQEGEALWLHCVIRQLSGRIGDHI
jgi:hypothetical protein